MATSREEIKSANAVHVGCGGRVIVSLDGDFCARCGNELREDDWLTLTPDDLYADVRAWPPGLPGGTP